MYWAANAKPDVALVDALKGLGHVGLDVDVFRVKTYQQRMAQFILKVEMLKMTVLRLRFQFLQDDHQDHSTDSIMESVFGREDKY